MAKEAHEFLERRDCLLWEYCQIMFFSHPGYLKNVVFTTAYSFFLLHKDGAYVKQQCFQLWIHSGFAYIILLCLDLKLPVKQLDQWINHLSCWDGCGWVLSGVWPQSATDTQSFVIFRLRSCGQQYKFSLLHILEPNLFPYRPHETLADAHLLFLCCAIRIYMCVLNEMQLLAFAW